MGNIITREEYEENMRTGQYDDIYEKPIPCASPECDGYYIEFDFASDTYECPNCGRIVHILDREVYLDAAYRGENPKWEDPIYISYSDEEEWL